eukprot:1657066-Amphidinium_carterae.1
MSLLLLQGKVTCHSPASKRSPARTGVVFIIVFFIVHSPDNTGTINHSGLLCLTVVHAPAARQSQSPTKEGF